MRKTSKNYWPHAILISIFLIVLACVYTIIEALKHPVEMDNFYFQSYYNVDKNYDKIEAAQKSFVGKYNVNYKTEELSVGKENKIVLSITDKLNQAVNNASIKLLVTRPETNSYNQQLSENISKNGEYIFFPINIEKSGRWQFQTKIIVGEEVGFFKHEENITR